jgi:hypothetical protein
MLAVPLGDLELPGDHAFHHPHGRRRGKIMLLAAARILEKAGQEDKLDHAVRLSVG